MVVAFPPGAQDVLVGSMEECRLCLAINSFGLLRFLGSSAPCLFLCFRD